MRVRCAGAGVRCGVSLTLTALTEARPGLRDRDRGPTGDADEPSRRLAQFTQVALDTIATVRRNDLVLASLLPNR